MKSVIAFGLLLLLSATITAQTVTTSEKCYFLSDKYGLGDLYLRPLEDVKLGTIPKNKTLPIIGTDTLQGKLIKVEYKNQIGWIHRTVVKDQFMINCGLRLTDVSLNGVSQALSKEDMFYEDSIIAIKWGKGLSRINIVLHNKSNRSLTIDWDRSSWVGLDLMSEKFMHNGVKYAERNQGQPKTTIPSGARITDMVLPNSLVYYDDYLGWKENLLLMFYAKHEYEASDIANGLISKQIKVLLTFESGNSLLEYDFCFKIDNPIIAELESGKKPRSKYMDDTYE